MKTLAVTITIKDRASGEGHKFTEDVCVEYDSARGMWRHELPSGVWTDAESSEGLAARVAADTVQFLRADGRDEALGSRADLEYAVSEGMPNAVVSNRRGNKPA
jgi:hypothetical protein